MKKYGVKLVSLGLLFAAGMAFGMEQKTDFYIKNNSKEDILVNFELTPEALQRVRMESKHFMLKRGQSGYIGLLDDIADISVCRASLEASACPVVPGDNQEVLRKIARMVGNQKNIKVYLVYAGLGRKGEVIFNEVELHDMSSGKAIIYEL